MRRTLTPPCPNARPCLTADEGTLFGPGACAVSLIAAKPTWSRQFRGSAASGQRLGRRLVRQRWVVGQ
jgi:hypothetical protein